MSTAKVAVSLDRRTLTRVDRLVRRGLFPSRSRLVQDSIEEKLGRLDRARLARECAKLDRGVERALAEEGLEPVAGWPPY
ncbi:MAG TPA: ribbon-helix-helix domain-containing protein [Thermoanaerobaculia bacterium]|nr:ribbon-helix-helix domain-containing protein [Thermoanaerobaculia bacterium]